APGFYPDTVRLQLPPAPPISTGSSNEPQEMFGQDDLAMETIRSIDVVSGFRVIEKSNVIRKNQDQVLGRLSVRGRRLRRRKRHRGIRGRTGCTQSTVRCHVSKGASRR